MEPESQHEQFYVMSSPHRRIALTLGLVVLTVGMATLWYQRVTAPLDATTTVIVNPGDTLKIIAHTLLDAGVIRNATLFYLETILHHDPTLLKAGTHEFNGSYTPRDVATYLTSGELMVHDAIAVTLREGERSELWAHQLEEALPEFDDALFLKEAIPLEGRLFPDTYFFPSDATATSVIAILRNTFTERITPYEQKIQEHQLSMDEIIILASILEREANSEESMRMVAGILLERLRINMPLQVDASIEYVLDKPLQDLTAEDLTIDNPYNTYTRRGLPPTPIGNPGLTAIQAVLSPLESPYLFYITDETGTFHYAEDFAGHQRNIARYLRS